MDRRHFLKFSALSSSSLALSSCAHLDRIFMGDPRDLRHEVVILGGGAAGLAAAFELKKNKVPFRIFEASSRLGGRIHSVSIFSEQNAVAELGAEFFDETHASLFAMAKELNLVIHPVNPLEGLEPQVFYFDRKKYLLKDLKGHWQPIYERLQKLRENVHGWTGGVSVARNSRLQVALKNYDSLSLRALLTSWQKEVHPVVLKIIESQAEARFGADSDDQSALHFISTLTEEGSALLSGHQLYRMEGGLGSLMQVLANRVNSVIPNYVVKLNSPLHELEKKNGDFILSFIENGKKQVYKAQNIICTIPFSRLRFVSGLEQVGFSDLKKEMIQDLPYASHSKGSVVFEKPFWRQKKGPMPACVGNFSGDFLSQKIWDSGRGQNINQGLLSFQRSGRRAVHAGVEVFSELQKDLESIYGNMPKPMNNLSYFVNWQNRPWASGSMSYYKPDQYLKYYGVAAESACDGRFQFAGEHTSAHFAGSVEGALESGKRASLAIIKNINSLS